MSDQLAADDEHDRPREQPGAVRRDCEPHRGPLLRLLGAASVVLGGLSPLACMLPPLPVFAALAALGLGSTVWVLARRDLRGMDAHRVDPAGRALAYAGLLCGGAGAVIGAAVLLLVAALFVADHAIR